MAAVSFAAPLAAEEPCFAWDASLAVNIGSVFFTNALTIGEHMDKPCRNHNGNQRGNDRNNDHAPLNASLCDDDAHAHVAAQDLPPYPTKRGLGNEYHRRP